MCRIGAVTLYSMVADRQDEERSPADYQLLHVNDTFGLDEDDGAPFNSHTEVTEHLNESRLTIP